MLYHLSISFSHDFRMLCRLTPPMCLNFLGLIHMDNHIIKTQIMEPYYTQVCYALVIIFFQLIQMTCEDGKQFMGTFQVMGHMVVLSIISDGFNIYFPMAVLAFCLATYFSLGSRLLSLIGFQQFLDDDELTAELVDEGRELVSRGD